MLKRNISIFGVVIMIVLAAFVTTGCQSKSSGTGSEAAQQRVTSCKHCGGTGVCSHCNGEKYRDGRRCRSCNGEGYCDNCQGKGEFIVYVIDGQDCIQCGSCHGNGKCDVCGGSGELQSWNSNSFGQITGNCLLCKGDGKCKLCHGSGYVRLSPF